MDPYGHPDLIHLGEERLEFGPVERLAVHVGDDLYAAGAVFLAGKEVLEIFRREKVSIRADPHETINSASVGSIGNDDVDERLLAAEHGFARTREGRRQLFGLFDPFAMPAL